MFTKIIQPHYDRAPSKVYILLPVYSMPPTYPDISTNIHEVLGKH